MSGERVSGGHIVTRPAEPQTWCQACLPNDANEVNDATVCIEMGSDGLRTVVNLCGGCCRQLVSVVAVVPS